MKVLMITPIVDEDHDILGFIPSWIRGLSKRVDKLFVITSKYNKETPLEDNTEVYAYTLGKNPNRVAKFFYLNRIMINLTPKIDIIFCHMYPNFTLMVAPYAKLFKVPIITWYTHGHVSRRLRIAHFLADKMVTASKESLRIKSSKIIITGHGIDTNRFKPAANQNNKRDKETILSVGRISPRKNLETLIKAADILVNEKGMKDLEFVIVGGVPVASQEEYYGRLKKMIKELEMEDYVKFVGAVPYSEVVEYYQNCDVFISTSQTGSVDKVVLEAMACEKPVIVCNEAFEDVFGDYSKILMFNKEDSYDLAQKIIFILEMDEEQRDKLCFSMRQIIKKEHNVEGLMDKLVKVFEACGR